MVKNPTVNAEDMGSIPGFGKFPGQRNGDPLKYSCLGKSHGQKSLAGYTVHGVTKNKTQLRD